MRRFLRCGLVAGLLLGTATAQRLAAYDPFGSLITDLQPPTVLLPVPPNPPLFTYPTIPVFPPPGPFVVVPGDSTFDNLVGLHWFTDGTTIAAMPSPSFPPIGVVPPPFAVPPAVLGAIGGPVTGMAIDPVGSPAMGPIIWVTSAPGMVVGFAALLPTKPMVGPPLPLPFAQPAPITGLEWDGATGTLWAVDITSVAYNFFPFAGPAGPPVLPFVVTGPAGDIAIDKIGSFNPTGLRPLYVVGGPLVVDIRDPAAVPFPAGPPGEGLAFVDTPAEIPPLPGCEGCPGVTAGPTAFTTSVMSSGNGGFMVGMGGLVPGASFGVFAFDTVTAPPPFPFPNGPTACPLGLTISPSLILLIGGPADPAGNILTPVPLTGVPVGAFLHNQNFTFCGAQPSGLAFSRFQTITAGGF